MESGGSVLDGNYPGKWVSSGRTSTATITGQFLQRKMAEYEALKGEIEQLRCEVSEIRERKRG